jgi:hypothetical protein
MELVFQQELHFQEGDRQVPELKKQVRPFNLDQLLDNSDIKKTLEQSLWTDHQLVHRLMPAHQPLPSFERDQLRLQQQ